MALRGPAPRRRPDDTIEGRPLPPQRLAAIWRSLPDKDRLAFLLSLEEGLADQVMILTVDKPASAAGQTGTNAAEGAA